MSKKWIVRSMDKEPKYKMVLDDTTSTNWYDVDMATRFNTKEEAQEWANAHQDVIEVEE